MIESLIQVLKEAAPLIEGFGVKSLQPVEKVIFFRLIKNAQMQVESAKSRLRGLPRAFHLPIRQAILAVASRRIRSNSWHAREKVSGRNAADACLPVGRGVFQQPVYPAKEAVNSG